MPRRSTGLLAKGERRVPVRGPITKLVATACVARLLVLAAEEEHEPILAYIDSPGGLASEALRILSSLHGIECPIATFSRGKQGGPATALAAHGLKGFRSCSPNARFSFRFDPETSRHHSTEEALEALMQIVVSDTGQSVAQVRTWFETGAEFTAPQAIASGLIDQISTKPVLPE